MAKGNLFQGMAKGKIGDVVFSRLNGQQVSRVRNRAPRNPKTNAQLYQRAVMATIMQAYSAGKEIFDHSFQGKAVGSACQQYFMSINAKKLRATIANEVNNNVPLNDQVGRVVWPGANACVPGQYIIAEGTYDQALLTESISSGMIGYSMPAPASAEETVAEYVARNGIIADDYYTFVIIYTDESSSFDTPGSGRDYLGKGFAGNFGFIRLHVKRDLASVDTAISTFGDIFDVDKTVNITRDVLSIPITTPVRLQTLDPNGLGCGAIGLIRSRKDVDLRSNCTLFCPSRSDASDQYFGIVSGYALAAWQAETQQLGDSDLILEGGNF